MPQKPAEREDAEWQRLRRVNCRRLLAFPVVVVLVLVAWYFVTFDPAYTR